ncbi:tRNA pseudouridine(13) synthase TruD [Geomonas sp. RF6]|uniref:tRNA pseudouridine(13) synthase TruD n=1 Tax=Geomonas sp. RF6 TaxID=2897342 RepID=UPI001E46817F|nr:tRNA pseudouridine(13) synthase TruD [Geomonas sp. RF6]UFS68864.1 tRNA pseudouridine(13) synthase TruD [Geomonas sp. RF6]
MQHESKYLTAGIPGTGGVIKETPEDFVVEEIPAYLPSGQGEHCYAVIEKRGIATLEALRRISRALGVQERDMGYAGMKDAQGLTRQTISIPRVSPDAVRALQIPGVAVLSAAMHGNKLRLGHLKGNRFTVRVRSVAGNAPALAEETLEIVRRRGLPNRFGVQRYGVQGNTHLIGACMLRGDYRAAVDTVIGDPKAVADERWRLAIEAYHRGELAEALSLFPPHFRVERDLIDRLLKRPDAWQQAFNAVQPRMKRLYLSAFQSFLFDKVLDGRLDTLDRILPGDIAFKHENGACFIVQDAEVEQTRADSFEISPTGPMFGCTMMEPSGEQLELEQGVLEAHGVTRESFALPGALRMDGERRALRVPVSETVVQGEGENLVLSFALPRGSYATSLLREIMKVE